MIIDCGGTLRCGIYPQKRIPTININPVGKSGPMAKYITEDIYVSGVKNDNIALADGSAAPISEAAPAKEEKDFKYSADKKVSETMGSSSKSSLIQKMVWELVKSLLLSIVQRKNLQTQYFIRSFHSWDSYSLLIGIIQGSGFGNWFAKLLQPLCGNIIGLVILRIYLFYSILKLSAWTWSCNCSRSSETLIGVEIGKGNI